MPSDSSEFETPKEEFRNIIDEARLILPGIQSLFGFQTIAVFNQRYTDLPVMGQVAHLCALGMIVIAIGLIMTPASYHRIVEPGRDTRRKIRLASRLVCIALLPPALGIALDTFVVAVLATDNVAGSCIAGLAIFGGLATSWFVFPYIARVRANSGT